MRKTLQWLALLMGISAVSTSAFADSLSSDFEASLSINDQYVTGLGQITAIRFLPDGRLLIAERTGALRIRNTDGSTVLAHTFQVNAGPQEQGLLGIAVQPDFATSKRIVAYWSASDASGGSNANRHRVSSFVLNSNTLDASSEKKLVENGIAGPANHNGGALDFGPDGLLYIGTGDTGCNQTPPAPPTLHQNLLSTAFNSLNGKVLRLSVEGATAGNPFTQATNVSGVTLPYACKTPTGSSVPVTTSAARPEIYALGFRNAFRLWVDPKTGFVWVGDVGEVQFEEIDILTKAGLHAGYPFLEGPTKTNGWPLEKCAELSPNPGNCLYPSYICQHSPSGNVTLRDETGNTQTVRVDGDCRSIIGGRIFDACELPTSLRGRYVYADSVSNDVYSLAVAPTRAAIVPASRKKVFTASSTPTEMIQGPDGSLYSAHLDGHITRVFAKTAVTDLEACKSVADAGPAPLDASTPDTPATSNDATSNDTGLNNLPKAVNNDGSCSCTTVGSKPSPVPWSALVAVVALLLARKRVGSLRTS